MSGRGALKAEPPATRSSWEPRALWQTSPISAAKPRGPIKKPVDARRSAPTGRSARALEQCGRTRKTFSWLKTQRYPFWLHFRNYCVELTAKVYLPAEV